MGTAYHIRQVVARRAREIGRFPPKISFPVDETALPYLTNGSVKSMGSALFPVFIRQLWKGRAPQPRLFLVFADASWAGRESLPKFVFGRPNAAAAYLFTTLPSGEIYGCTKVWALYRPLTRKRPLWSSSPRRLFFVSFYNKSCPVDAKQQFERGKACDSILQKPYVVLPA